MDQSIQNQIAGLPLHEQLEIAEFIYESLASSGRLVTEEQMAETRRRSKQIDEHPESLLTREQMWNQVEQLRNARKD